MASIERTPTNHWLAEALYGGAALAVIVTGLLLLLQQPLELAAAIGLGVAGLIIGPIQISRLTSHSPQVPQPPINEQVIAESLHEAIMHQLPDHVKKELEYPSTYFVQPGPAATQLLMNHAAAGIAKTLEDATEQRRKRRYKLLASMHDFLVMGEYIGYKRECWCPPYGDRRPLPTAGRRMSLPLWRLLTKNLKKHGHAEVTRAGVKLVHPVDEVLACYGLKRSEVGKRLRFEELQADPNHLIGLVEN